MKGFTVCKKDSSLESVKFENNLEMNLLSRGDGIEVIQQIIEKDKLFYLYPSEHKDSFEFYYIISGRITCKLDDSEITLNKGDYFSVNDLEEPIHFTVKSTVTLLCIFTEPTFIHVSHEMASLMEIIQKVESKDKYTYKHSDRVAKYSVKIARKLKLSKQQLERVTIAAVLHDIGKINVPIEVLNKPGRLTDEEFAIIKRHPVDGGNMIKGSYYSELVPIIEQHHERLNGTGYPHNLRDEEILIEAKIIAVSDTFDAMTEDRAYRKAFQEEIAIAEIKRLSGTHYDPAVVSAFEEVLKEEGRIK